MLFFSIPHGKRDVYIMPALPMACPALAPLLPGIVRKAWPRRIAWMFAFALVAACIGAGGDAIRQSVVRGALRHRTRLRTKPGASAVVWLLLAMGAWGIAGMLWFRNRPVPAMLSVLAGLWVLYGLAGYPVAERVGLGARPDTGGGREHRPARRTGLVAWKNRTC